MNKFVLVSFMVLGWAYYEMSGGADFTPERRETETLAAAEAVAPRVPIRSAGLTTGATPEAQLVLAPAPPLADAATPAVVAAVADSPDQAADATAMPEPEFVSLARPRIESRTVTANSLNVRLGPSTADPVIGRLTLGEEVAVALADSGNGWTMIRIEGDGIEGWVSTRFLSP